MNRLTPCPSCARHVRLDRASCPFCEGSLAGVRAPEARPVSRSRAALVGVAAGLLVSACGGGSGSNDNARSGDDTQSGGENPEPPADTANEEPTRPPNDAPPVYDDPGAPVALYGAPY